MELRGLYKDKLLNNVLPFWTNNSIDKENVGLFYMMDIKGHPTQQLEWGQKLWWVQQEAILAVLKAYAYRR